TAEHTGEVLWHGLSALAPHVTYEQSTLLHVLARKAAHLTEDAIRMASQRRRTARRHSLASLPWGGRRPRAIGGQVSGRLLADDSVACQQRAGHGWPSGVGGSGKVASGLG